MINSICKYGLNHKVLFHLVFSLVCICFSPSSAEGHIVPENLFNISLNHTIGRIKVTIRKTLHLATFFSFFIRKCAAQTHSFSILAKCLSFFCKSGF